MVDSRTPESGLCTAVEAPQVVYFAFPQNAQHVARLGVEHGNTPGDYSRENDDVLSFYGPQLSATMTQQVPPSFV